MPSLQGRRIALLESRKTEELGRLVSRLGGEVVAAPTVREVPRREDVRTFLEGLAAHRFGVAIFLTGVGADALLAEAERQDRLADTLALLRDTIIACRGPKPLAVMRRRGLSPQVVTDRPHTHHELLEALRAVSLQSVGAVLVHYGERNPELADALRSRGALLEEVCPYEWALPIDQSPIVSVIRDALNHRLDAMLFTSQVQCRHLFEVAGASGLAADLTARLNDHIVVGAVGPVCADALRHFGVTPDVIPAAPNMGSLIAAIGDYFDLTREEGTEGAEGTDPHGETEKRRQN